MGGNVWDAEQHVDAQRARLLLERQFPQLAGAPVEPLADGFDNTVFLVAGTWAVRFPRRAVAVALLPKEVRLLPALAAVLPLPVPVPELVGEPDGDYPWPFWGGRLVPGVELCEAGLPEHDRAGLAADLGRFLAALHTPELAAQLGEGLDTDPMRRAIPGVRGPIGRTCLDRLTAHGQWTAGSGPDRAVNDLFARGAELGPPSGDPVLCHGDFHLRHVLVSSDARAAGVIDWGDACLADPALDLSFGYAAFTGRARAAFFRAYGEQPGPERQLRARVLAAALCAALAEYAAVQGRPALLAESLAGVARATG